MSVPKAVLIFKRSDGLPDKEYDVTSWTRSTVHYFAETCLLAKSFVSYTIVADPL